MFHLRKVRRPEQPARARRQHEMDADDVGGRQQLLLCHHGGAGGLGLFLGEVLASADHLHAQRAPQRVTDGDAAQAAPERRGESQRQG